MSERTLAVPPALVPAAPPVQVPGPPPSVRSTSGGAGAGAAPGRPVLVVEDEPGLAEVLAVHLQASRYQPIIAHDGLEALYALDRVTPHAVLLDLHLPQVSGFRLIQLLKQRPDVPRVPVIVLTALSFQEAEDA